MAQRLRGAKGRVDRIFTGEIEWESTKAEEDAIVLRRGGSPEALHNENGIAINWA